MSTQSRHTTTQLPRINDVFGISVASILSMSPARTQYLKARSLGLGDDAWSEAIATILEHHRPSESPRPKLLAFRVSDRLESMMRSENRLGPTSRVTAATAAPPGPDPDLPVDPFDLVPLADRDLVRDYYYDGSCRKTSARSNLSKTTINDRVRKAVNSLRREHS